MILEIYNAEFFKQREGKKVFSNSKKLGKGTVEAMPCESIYHDKKMVISHNKDVKRIKELYKMGNNPMFPSNNNYVIIGGECFNGFTKEQVCCMLGIKKGNR